MTMHWSVVRVACLLLLTGLTYFYTWYWLYMRWTAPDSSFAHGFLVPAVFLWLLFRRREEIERIDPEPSYLGLVLILPALVLHLLAVFLEVYSPSGFTLPILMGGTILYFRGWKVLRKLLFPVCYLYFAIPLPMNWVLDATLVLKNLAITSSTTLAKFMGAAVHEEGSSLVFASGATLEVASPCSGLRSLIALLALGVLYAVEFTSLSFCGRAVFIVLSVPIALLSNILRICFLCLVVHYLGKDAAGGVVHYGSGLAIYAVSLAVMIGLSRVLRAVPFFRREPCETGT